MNTLYRSTYLPEFQKYLTERRLAPENRIPFLARWAQMFLHFNAEAKAAGIPFDIGLERFLKHISLQEKTQPWQIQNGGFRRWRICPAGAGSC